MAFHPPNSFPFGSFSGASISAGMFGTSSPFSSLNGVSSSVGTTWGSSPFDMSTTVASKPSTNFGIPTPVGFASTSGPTFDTSSAFSFGGPSTSAGPSFCTSVPFSFFNGSSTSAGICGTSAPVSSFNGASSSVGQTTWGPYNPIGTSTTFASKPSTSWTQPSFLDAQRLQVGTSSVFDNNTRGSKVASYTSTREVDNTKILSISAMQVYKDKSHEELRSEDYELLKKPANSPFSTPYPNNFFDTFKRSSFGPTHDQSVNPFPTTTSTFPPKPNPIDSIFRTPVPAPSVNYPTNTSTFLFKPQDSIFKTSISAAPVNPFSFTPNPSTSQPPPFPFPDSNMFKPSVPAPPVNPFLPSTSTFPPQPSPCINPNNSIFNHPGPVNPLFPTTSTFPPQPSPCINPNNSIFNHPGPVNPLFPTTSTFPPLPSPCINPNNSIFNPPGPVNSFYTTSSIFPSQPSPSVLPVPPVNQQPNGQQCIQIQPVVVVNPFASKPTLEVPATRPNQVTPIQYGISSMQAVSKAPSPTSKTTLWRSVRHVSLRQTSSPAHKRNPVNSKNKVTFIFGKNEEGICRSSPFQPRQNPRSWVMSAQTEESPKSQYQNDVEISAMMPKLPEGEEYHIEPSVEELKAKERAEPGFCSRVKNFVVGRRDKGSIRFLGETDIRNLDIGSSVIFNDREVIVNSGDSVGIGLNKPAEVTMLNVNCVTKEKKLVTDGLHPVGEI